MHVHSPFRPEGNCELAKGRPSQTSQIVSLQVVMAFLRRPRPPIMHNSNKCSFWTFPPKCGLRDLVQLGLGLSLTALVQVNTSLPHQDVDHNEVPETYCEFSHLAVFQATKGPKKPFLHTGVLQENFSSKGLALKAFFSSKRAFLMTSPVACL